jgi:hypothetical protein
LYSQGRAQPIRFFPPRGNCIGYFPDEWMTFQVRVRVGQRIKDEFVNSAVQLWVGREGQPSQLAIDESSYTLSAGDPAQNQRFGKVWLLPYNTNKNASQAHAVGYVWYDELIVSRERIPDPQP